MPIIRQLVTKSAVQMAPAKSASRVAARERAEGIASSRFIRVKTFRCFLLAVYRKGEKANLTKAERNELKRILGDIVRNYSKGVKRHV